MLEVAGDSGGAGESEHNISARKRQHWARVSGGGDGGRRLEVDGDGDGDGDSEEDAMELAEELMEKWTQEGISTPTMGGARKPAAVERPVGMNSAPELRSLVG
ncbi:hypothetical protein G7Z17_g6376 [Cylindrodendrum hubeiense]|uniref:Uncharacterized protein n=1 Tax=Cylindrodendrum hubeiense TaxID=595255 RepID=A0A9P5H4U0_9HYPO|nr:hypothetical protein G7Z17_g6376 [Cylindrodendrum hubeiense]